MSGTTSGQRRGAPLKVLDDRTPLTADRIDVAARIAWLLRTARLTAPETRNLPQYAMVERLRAVGLDVSRNWVHRLEAGDLRSGRGADAYEQALGLGTGQLRATIDLVCRTVPDSPPDSDRHEHLRDVEELSAMTEAILASPCAGWEWLRWAREFSRPDVLGLRVLPATELLGRLASELGRAVGSAYDTRYEAFAALRGGPYGRLALRVAADVLADEHVQVVRDLVSAVTEHPDAECMQLCLGLLRDDRPRVVLAAVHGLENVVAGGRADVDWKQITAAAVEAFNRSETGSMAWHSTAHLLRMVPPPRLRDAGLDKTLNKSLPPPVTPTQGGREATLERWTRCVGLASAITEEVGIHEEPMLARLLFDLLMGWAEWKAFASARLLSALPFAPVIVAKVVAFVADEPDPSLRGQMLRRLSGIAGTEAPAGIEAWLQRPGGFRETALVILAHGGVPPPTELVTVALARGGDEASRALYAAGMTGHRMLAGIRDDSGHPPPFRGAAAWWLREGSRIVDEPALD